MNSQLIGFGILNNGLYQLVLSPNLYQSFAVESSVSKRSLCAENSCLIWHKRLGHISRERIQRLVKNNILPSLDFGDMGTCVDCIRGKFAKSKKKGSTRSSELLEIIHTDISGPYPNTLCGHKYFITFIDDFS